MTKENLIFGIRPVIEAIKAGKEIDRVLMQNGLKSENSWELKKLIAELNIPVQYVPIDKLNRVTFKNHQGVICYISEVAYQPLENILPMIFEKGENPFLLICDRITDVRNFGAIARTAECAGVHAIIIPSKGAARINADTVKTSAGAIYKIPVCREDNLKNTIDFLKESGIEIIACTEKATVPYHSIDYNKPIAIIMGSEEDGISQEYLKKSDKTILIPLQGETESLNVSVAAGIILFEAVKQKLNTI
ncbi:MAG: 23S rRNA (guanosine(2251)-2'-O)-methyltransferase RlmB [Bacteroidetes bacterium]|nr:23S rRNA (guanosine(2251)-2'-O)-methyltransferase RlmB [Bacteroidota bacterium]